MKTLIGIVMDESSSMNCRRQEVINGFNSFVDNQKKITEDSARLFLVKFHSTVRVVYKSVPLEDVKPMTNSDYQPQASTALCDAISQCVRIMDEEKTAEERAICVIMTDGEENCSQRTTMSDIRQIISSHEQQNNWTFIYIGVEIAEWMRRSGMRATHCSRGFTPVYNSPPPAYSPVLNNLMLPHLLSSRLNARSARSTPLIPNAGNINLEYNPFANILSDSGDNMVPESSSEMAMVDDLISDYRRSDSGHIDEPFSSKSSNN